MLLLLQEQISSGIQIFILSHVCFHASVSAAHCCSSCLPSYFPLRREKRPLQNISLLQGWCSNSAGGDSSQCCHLLCCLSWLQPEMSHSHFSLESKPRKVLIKRDWLGLPYLCMFFISKTNLSLDRMENYSTLARPELVYTPSCCEGFPGVFGVDHSLTVDCPILNKGRKERLYEL